MVKPAGLKSLVSSSAWILPLWFMFVSKAICALIASPFGNKPAYISVYHNCFCFSLSYYYDVRSACLLTFGLYYDLSHALILFLLSNLMKRRHISPSFAIHFTESLECDSFFTKVLCTHAQVLLASSVP